MANMTAGTLRRAMLDLDSGFDRGHDPYNYTGKSIRRAEAWDGLKTKMRDKVFVMDRMTYKDFYKPMLAELRPEPRFTQWLGVDYAIRPSQTIITDVMC